MVGACALASVGCMRLPMCEVCGEGVARHCCLIQYIIEACARVHASRLCFHRIVHNSRAFAAGFLPHRVRVPLRFSLATMCGSTLVRKYGDRIVSHCEHNKPCQTIVHSARIFAPGLRVYSYPPAPRSSAPTSHRGRLKYQGRCGIGVCSFGICVVPSDGRLRYFLLFVPDFFPERITLRIWPTQPLARAATLAKAAVVRAWRSCSRLPWLSPPWRRRA